MTRVVVWLCMAAGLGNALAAAGDAGWVKCEKNPVLGGKLGACGDVSVMKEENTYRLWFSWRPKKSIAHVESTDGLKWGEPQVVLGPNTASDWEENVSQPSVYKRPHGYHLWYTGEARQCAWIGHAVSDDGVTWTRELATPAVSPDRPWEKAAVMCPAATWDPVGKVFCMWYSGGEPDEPDAIGFATSVDGNVWRKHKDNPVFRADPKEAWEKHKVTACQVLRREEWYYMFYIGFRDTDHAQIGVARSKDGLTNWQRHPKNPIISPTKDAWDHDACYKPYAIFDEAADRWMLWYNGRKGDTEQIGLATHAGEDLGFEGQ